MKLLQSRPEAERRKQLIIEIEPASRAMDDEQVIGAIKTAKSITGTILLRAAPTDRAAIVSRSHGVSSLSWRFSTNPNAAVQSTAKVLAQFAADASRVGLHPYVFNLDVLGMVKAAVEARFPLIGGRAVGREQEVPGDAYALQKNRLFFG